MLVSPGQGGQRFSCIPPQACSVVTAMVSEVLQLEPREGGGCGCEQVQGGPGAGQGHCCPLGNGMGWGHLS